MNGLLIAALVFTALIAGRFALWMFRPDKRDGSKRRIPVISAVGLGLIAGFFWWTGIRHYGLEAKLDAVASQIVGKPVRVKCETFLGFGIKRKTEGEVWFTNGVPESETVMKRGACEGLLSYIRSDKAAPSDQEVMGVGVLTHESMHMAGHHDEAAAECASVQRMAETAVLLGADEASAQALARSYMEIWYPRLPGRYRTSECARGAGLDEELALPPW